MITSRIYLFLIIYISTWWAKNFATFFIAHISWFENMIKSWFFFEKMRRKKFYKNYIKKSLLNCSDGFSILNMNNLHGSATSQKIKMFDNHTVCLRRIFKKRSKCYHFLKSRYMQNRKSLLNIFIMLENSTIT
jgi:hypothetical protein